MTFSLSFSDGCGGKICAVAKGEIKKDFLCVSYIFDGAEYRLTVTPEVLISVRGGDCPLEISFKEDEPTYAKVGVCGESGYIPVKTSSLRASFLPHGCHAVVKYLLGEEARSAELIATCKEKAF